MIEIAPNTAAFVVLKMIKDIGPVPRAQVSEHSEIMRALSLAHYTRLDRQARYYITAEGKEFISQSLKAAAPKAEMRTVTMEDMRPSTIQALQRPCLRPGAYDLENAPSLEFGQRVSRTGEPL